MTDRLTEIQQLRGAGHPAPARDCERCAYPGQAGTCFCVHACWSPSCAWHRAGGGQR